MKYTKFKSIHDPCPYGNDDCPKCNPLPTPSKNQSHEGEKKYCNGEPCHCFEDFRMTKTEQIRELKNMKCPQCGIFFSNCVELREFIFQLLAEQREDYKKTLNSGRKMYQQGREDEKNHLKK